MKRRLVRLLGALVCLFRGHDFYYPCGCYDSRFAHSCIRCGELSRPLDELVARSIDEINDDCFYESFGPSDEEIALDHEQARRWFPRFKYPRWI